MCGCISAFAQHLYYNEKLIGLGHITLCMSYQQFKRIILVSILVVCIIIHWQLASFSGSVGG